MALPLWLWLCLSGLNVTLKYAVKGEIFLTAVSVILSLSGWAFFPLIYKSLKNAPKLKAKGQVKAPATATLAEANVYQHKSLKNASQLKAEGQVVDQSQFIKQQGQKKREQGKGNVLVPK